MIRTRPRHGLRADSNPRFGLVTRPGPRIGVMAVVLVACGEDPGANAALERRVFPLEAICEAEVDGSGRVDVETDYLPHVIACENGGADFAALQAQAVAARTYLYYKIGRQGHIGDGQGDQVYSCGRGPGPEHIEAAASTAGRVLRYHGDVIAAFYVAGAIPSTGDCRPAPGDRDPTGTEHFVTYNEGRSGEGIEQTTLGWVNPQNWANRGCKSQNGADCLAEHGYAWEDIVRFYYGDDIEIIGTDGPCVAPPPPLPPDAAPPPPPPDAAPPPPPLPPDAAAFDAEAQTPPEPPDAAGSPDASPVPDAAAAPADAAGLGADGGPLAVPSAAFGVPARTKTANLSGGCGAVPARLPARDAALALATLAALAAALERRSWRRRRD